MRDMNIKQYKAYRKINMLRRVLVKTETQLYDVENEKRGALRRQVKVEEVAELAKELPDPVTNRRKVIMKSLGELIDEDMEKEKKKEKQESKKLRIVQEEEGKTKDEEDLNRFNFTSEQNRLTFNRCRERWASLATDPTPSPGLSPRTSTEPQRNIPKSTKNSKKGSARETSSMPST